MPYVDAFVVAVPKDGLAAYKATARTAGEVWKGFGALAYVECIGDDVPYGELTSFPRAVQANDNEIIAFSWIAIASAIPAFGVSATSGPAMTKPPSCRS